MSYKVPWNMADRVVDSYGTFAENFQRWFTSFLAAVLVSDQVSITAVDGAFNELFDIDLQSGGRTAGVVRGTAEVTNGTDYQILAFAYGFAAVNKGGVYSTQIADLQPAIPVAASSGALVMSPAPDFLTGTNKVTFRIGVDTSLVGATITVKYTIDNLSVSKITRL